MQKGHNIKCLIIQGFQWILAIFVATIVTSVFVLFYYYSGVHVGDPTGSTDYKWKPHQFSGNAYEGFAHFKMDENGFNNDVQPSTIDVLLMGSSHMEAAQISREDNAASILSNSTGLGIYNIAIAGNSFLMNLDNLKAAVETYSPKSYIVIHADTLSYTDEQWVTLEKGKMTDVPYAHDGLLLRLRNIPSLKLMYKQMVDKAKADLTFLMNSNNISQITENENFNYHNIENCLREAASICDDAGCGLIVVYTPTLKLGSKSELLRSDNIDFIKRFGDLCDNTGITFLDMYDAFKKTYDAEYLLPYGFFNSAPNTGHLNRTGHKLFAQLLYEIL